MQIKATCGETNRIGKWQNETVFFLLRVYKAAGKGLFIVSRGRERDNIFGGLEAGNKRQHQIKKKMQWVGQTLRREGGRKGKTFMCL